MAPEAPHEVGRGGVFMIAAPLQWILDYALNPNGLSFAVFRDSL